VSEDIYQDDQMNAESRELLAQLEIKALAALALRADDHHLGWLLIEYKEPHQYSSKEVSYLEILTKQIANILQNQHLLKEVNQRAKILQFERQVQNTLYQFTNELDKATSIDALLDSLAGFGKTIQADEYLIYLAEDVGLEHLRASKEIASIPAIYKKIRRSVKEIVLIPAVQEDQLWSEISSLFEDFVLNSVICIPLVLQKGRAQGFILFGHTQPNGFPADLLEQIKSIATQFSLALKNRLASEDAENAIHEAQVLVAASRMLTASVELEDVYKTMNQAFLSTGADKSLLGIYYLDENNQAAELELVDFAGPNTPADVVEAVVGTRQAISELGMPFLLTGLETGRTITIDNLVDDPKLNSIEKEGLLALDLAAAAFVTTTKWPFWYS
jgi:GAF domain-containing protein